MVSDRVTLEDIERAILVHQALIKKARYEGEHQYEKRIKKDLKFFKRLRNKILRGENLDE